MKNVLLALTIILFAFNAFSQDCQNDTTPPTIECVFGLAADTCGFGEARIDAREFIAFSTDSCTDVANLNFSFTSFMEDTTAIFTSSSDSVSIWVTDAAGNSSLCNTTLTIVNDSCLCDPNLEITAEIIPVCDENDGSIKLTTPTNGTYNYFWSTSDTTQNIDSLPWGSYSVTIVDEIGCPYIRIFEVPQKLQLETNTTPTCDEDGTASVSVSGGTPPYQYRWNNEDEGENIGDLSQGRYEVTVTDAEGCTATAIAEIENSIEVDIAVNYDCEGKGNIEITPRNGETLFTYEWSNGSTNSSLNNLDLGIYSVTITDANGCIRVEQIEVEEYQALEIVSLETFDNCDGTGFIFPEILGGELPYTYLWFDSDFNLIADGDSLVNLFEGLYLFTVQDANGCTTSSSVEVEVSPTFEVEIEVTANCEENSFGVKASIKGDENNQGAPYIYQWSNGASSPIANDLFSGFYILTVSNNYGCNLTKIVEITENYTTEFCNQRTLNGTIFLDQDNNCRYDTIELPINFPQIQVALVKDSLLDSDLILLENDFGAYVEEVQYREQRPFNRDGEYELFFNIQKPYTSDYQFLKISTNFPNNCNYRYIPIATLLEEDVSLPNFDIPIQLDESCELLTVDVSTPFLRRCFESTYYINYCNRSAVEVEDAYIEVQLDDFLDFVSSGLEATDLGANLYRFDLGTLAAGACGRFPIQVNVSCDAVLGQTHCTTASIFPTPDCLDWSGAELQITAECEIDSVLFTIENIGEEDMLMPSSYIAIEDVVMFSQGDFELRSREQIQLRFPKNGSTYRMQARQVNGLPYPSQPTVALEGCGINEVGDFSRGFVTQFSEDDAAIFTSTHCEENRGAYDPNDKQVFPKGVGVLGQIEQNVDLEYKIRFQNTGTDTAFTVVILDTLDARLDVNSVQAGASSHSYVFEVIGGNVLRFQFNNILLPDSTTNLEASQGFVQFRVSQNVDVPLGETILNDAAIYFDFNEPIITNQVSNQIGKDFLRIISAVANEPSPNFRVQVSPNPLDQVAIIEIEGQLLTDATFILYDFRGREVRQQRFSGNQFHFYRKNLVAGGYFFKIVRHNDIITTRKLVLTD